MGRVTRRPSQTPLRQVLHPSDETSRRLVLVAASLARWGPRRSCARSARGRRRSGPFEGVFVCEKCTTRIGDVASKDQGSIVASIWDVADLPRRPDLADKPPPAPIDVDEVYRTFEASLAVDVSGYDAMPHADLARTYEEMGLNSDALREAAIALDGRTSPSRDATHIALRVVLTPPLPSRGGSRC
jgi:hypothetical protein